MRPWSSIAFRLALNYGALVLLTTILVLAVFYVQTVGVLQSRIDRQIVLHADRMAEGAATADAAALAPQVQRALRDGDNADTEIFLLLDAQGAKVVGNIALLPAAMVPTTSPVEFNVVRDGEEAVGRLIARPLPGGGTLIVGSDMAHQREIESLFASASISAAVVTLLMAVAGAFVFRNEVDQRAGAIRRAVARVAEGHLGERIAESDRQDEFSRLDRDINRMLERIEQLMDGVRHVSNTIAHNLRTPLTRILLRLRSAEREGPAQQAEALGFAAREVAELGSVFDKLLQIAEVESGARRQSFGPVDLAAVVADVVDFYEPVAEERGARLTASRDGDTRVAGDADLLASAIANLVDNALKYTAAAGGAVVTARTMRQGAEVLFELRDNGSGVAPADLARIGTRFFRADRSQPGQGLGLASVQAIVRLHGGGLSYADASPGLTVRLVMPGV